MAAPGVGDRQPAFRLPGGYRAATSLDLAEMALRPTRLRARTTNLYLPARRVIVSDLRLPGRITELVWLTTLPAALIRKAVTT